MTPIYLLRGALHPRTSRMSMVALVIVVVMPMAPVQSDEHRLIMEQVRSVKVLDWQRKGWLIHLHSVMLLLPVCLWVKVVQVNLVHLVREDRLIPEKVQLMNSWKVLNLWRWKKSLTQGAVWMQVSRRHWAPRQGGKPRWTREKLLQSWYYC